jgi:hypothetical protein
MNGFLIVHEHLPENSTNVILAPPYDRGATKRALTSCHRIVELLAKQLAVIPGDADESTPEVVRPKFFSADEFEFGHQRGQREALFWLNDIDEVERAPTGEIKASAYLDRLTNNVLLDFCESGNPPHVAQKPLGLINER